jgi:hypothetical protein
LSKRVRFSINLYTMKNLLFIALLFLFHSANSQSRGSHIYEFKNKQLIQLITSIDTVIIRSNSNISVMLFRIENPMGSAHLPETDEISIKYMVSVGYGDDSPDNHLFNLGDYIYPKLLEFKELNKESFLVRIEHGIYGHRKKNGYLVKLKSVTGIK